MRAAAPNKGAGAAAFPWDEAMTVGLAVLRLSPAEFWRMTPRELGRALAPFTHRFAGAPSRDALAEMMRRFPDGR